ncbi:hypothetical protein [Aurantiacibacter aquimixticola]|uniref:DUF3576 domain-containing protein n=1 Tax=Aurantiacibacter aquimixticola TaxID=1958945 RepID=A0A419RUS9_9SPHN|nr:hypothetical protein [Aurantiacibacter aquimixticola]RJY09530.1 hypothetical protein D6201_09325 [Aurantiacibacter aquimixticola]
MRLALTILSAALLSACATVVPQTQVPPAPPRDPVQTQVPPTRPVVAQPGAGFRQPQILEAPGLSGIVREPATSLVRRFGQPRLNVTEGDMRKLQFTGTACVLDVFLYPLAPGAEPVATWIETRRASDGAPVDRLACIEALSQPG